MTELAADVDFIVSPTVQCVAPLVADLAASVAGGTVSWFDVAPRNTVPFNVLGWPAVTVPIGPGEHDMPMALQIIAHPGQDADLMDFAARVQTIIGLRLDAAGVADLPSPSRPPRMPPGRQE